MTIGEAFVELENYIDASDPDMDLVRNMIFFAYVVVVAALFMRPLLDFVPPYLLLNPTFMDNTTKPTIIHTYSQIYSIYSKQQRVSDKPINQIGSN